MNVLKARVEFVTGKIVLLIPCKMYIYPLPTALQKQDKIILWPNSSLK